MGRDHPGPGRRLEPAQAAVDGRASGSARIIMVVAVFGAGIWFFTGIDGPRPTGSTTCPGSPSRSPTVQPQPGDLSPLRRVPERQLRSRPGPGGRDVIDRRHRRRRPADARLAVAVSHLHVRRPRGPFGRPVHACPAGLLHDQCQQLDRTSLETIDIATAKGGIIDPSSMLDARCCGSCSGRWPRWSVSSCSSSRWCGGTGGDARSSPPGSRWTGGGRYVPPRLRPAGLRATNGPTSARPQVPGGGLPRSPATARPSGGQGAAGYGPGRLRLGARRAAPPGGGRPRRAMGRRRRRSGPSQCTFGTGYAAARPSPAPTGPAAPWERRRRPLGRPGAPAKAPRRPPGGPARATPPRGRHRRGPWRRRPTDAGPTAGPRDDAHRAWAPRLGGAASVEPAWPPGRPEPTTSTPGGAGLGGRPRAPGSGLAPGGAGLGGPNGAGRWGRTVPPSGSAGWPPGEMPPGWGPPPGSRRLTTRRGDGGDPGAAPP